MGCFSYVFVLRMNRYITSRSRRHTNGPRSDKAGFHINEISSDIWMRNDRRARLRINRAALNAFMRKMQRRLIRTLANRNALYTHEKTRFIHHCKHTRQPAIRLSD